MISILQVDPLEGRIRYTLRLATDRPEALQKEIVQRVDPGALEILRESVEALARVTDPVRFIADARSTGSMISRVIVPPLVREALRSIDGPLFVSTSMFGVPWELLCDGEQFWGVRYALGRQLVSDYPFAIVSDPPPRRRPRALVIGSDPAGTLPAVAEEVEGLCTILDDHLEVVCLSGPFATARAIVEQLGTGFDLIHYCGHAIDDTEAGPSLLTADNRALSAPLLQASTTGRPLVVMNACSSARPPAVPREQRAWGLADAFLHAGAIGVVGTLRDVRDGHALGFSQFLYAAILEGVPIGEALRRCRAAAVSGPNLDAVPTWLSFTLYGNPVLKLGGSLPAIRPTRPRATPLDAQRLRGAPPAPSIQLGAPRARRARRRRAALLVTLCLVVIAGVGTLLLPRDPKPPMEDAQSISTPARSRRWLQRGVLNHESFDLPKAVTFDRERGYDMYNGTWWLKRTAMWSADLDRGAWCMWQEAHDRDSIGLNSIRLPGNVLADHPFSSTIRIESTANDESGRAGLAIFDDNDKVAYAFTTDSEGLVAVAFRPRPSETLMTLFEGHARNFSKGGSNKLALVRQRDEISVYVNDELVQTVSHSPNIAQRRERIGVVGLGPGRFCFDDFIVYRIDPVADTAHVPSPPAAWNHTRQVISEFFNLPEGSTLESDSRDDTRYRRAWPITPPGPNVVWSREIVDGTYCLTNQKEARGVDFVPIRFDDPERRVSALPLSTEVQVEPSTTGTDLMGGGLLLQFRRGDKNQRSYFTYTIDFRGQVHLLRRGPRGSFDILYSAPAKAFNEVGFNKLAARKTAAGFELYVNDLLQEFVEIERGFEMEGPSAGLAAIGTGRFCFETFLAYAPEGSAPEPTARR